MKEVANMGQVFIFTASVKEYADPIIDEIDPHGIIKGRFYREVSSHQFLDYLELQN